MELKLNNLDELLKIVDHGPEYDVKQLREDSIKDPKWVTFGSGNIFRAYIARLGQDMLNKGVFDRGISVIESFGYDSLEKTYWPNDNLSLSVRLNNNGNFDTTLIANIAEALFLRDSWDRAYEIFESPNLKVASYIITEKGYNIFDIEGNIAPFVLSDLEKKPEEVSNLMVASVHLLHKRFKKGYPITMLSLDNLSKNGSVLKKSIITIAENLIERGVYEKDFLDYLNDESKVSFPWSMIDKITPGPADVVGEYLIEKGIDDISAIKKEKGAPIAKYVNSEEAEYLAIEDNFANGKIPFDEVGVYVVDRDTVDKIETMKVTACLNPLHTALAVYGCLLGYTKISDEMNDETLVKLISNLAYDEALPVVADPLVINPNDFVKEVIEVRFPNPYLPDTPQRIATDTSQKMSVRFGKTLKTYKNQNKDLTQLKYIPLVIAGWLRYLVGKDDNGDVFEISSDPMLETLKESLQGIDLGKFTKTDKLVELLKNEHIFGINLVENGLDNKILLYLEELLKEPGAVRKTLNKYTEEV